MSGEFGIPSVFSNISFLDIFCFAFLGFIIDQIVLQKFLFVVYLNHAHLRLLPSVLCCLMQFCK